MSGAAMRSAVLGALAALASIGVGACSGQASEVRNPDSGIGGAPPLATCSSDSNCGSTAGCVANRCVQRLTDLGDWAIQITPRAGSGSQLTETSAAGSMPVVVASPELMLQIPFSPGTGAT